MRADHCDSCDRAHFSGDLQNGVCPDCRRASHEREAERLSAADRLDRLHAEVFG